MQKVEREYMQVLKDYNVDIVKIRYGKHMIVYCRGPKNNEFRVSIPSSPSDRRLKKTFKAWINRMI